MDSPPASEHLFGLEFPAADSDGPPEDPLALLMRQIVGGFFMLTDGQGGVSKWSEPAELLFGLETSEALGRPLFGDLIELPCPPEGEAWRGFLERGEAPYAPALVPLVARNEKAGLSFAIELVFVPVKLDEGFDFSLFLEDLGFELPANLMLARMRQQHPVVVRAFGEALGKAPAPWEERRTAGTLVAFRPLEPTPWVQAELEARELARAEAEAEFENSLTPTDPGVHGDSIYELEDAAAVVARMIDAFQRIEDLERSALSLPHGLEDARREVAAVRALAEAAEHEARRTHTRVEEALAATSAGEAADEERRRLWERLERLEAGLSAAREHSDERASEARRGAEAAQRAAAEAGGRAEAAEQLSHEIRGRAADAGERAEHAGRRAGEAEERALEAERRASAAESRAAEADARATAAEQHARQAGERSAHAEETAHALAALRAEIDARLDAESGEQNSPEALEALQRRLDEAAAESARALAQARGAAEVAHAARHELSELQAAGGGEAAEAAAAARAEMALAREEAAAARAEAAEARTLATEAAGSLTLHDGRATDQERALEALRAGVEELARDRDDTRGIAAAAHSELDALRARREEDRAALDALRARREEDRAALDALRAHRDEDRAALDALRAHRDEDRAGTDSLRDEVARTGARIDSLGGSIAELQTSAGEARDALEHQGAGLAHTRDELDGLRSDQASFAGELEGLRSGQASLAGELDGLRSGQASFAGELEGLRSGHESLAGELDGLRAGQASLSAQLDGLRTGQAELRHAFENAPAGGDALAAELDEIRSGVSALDGRIDGLGEQAAAAAAVEARAAVSEVGDLARDAVERAAAAAQGVADVRENAAALLEARTRDEQRTAQALSGLEALGGRVEELGAGAGSLRHDLAGTQAGVGEIAEGVGRLGDELRHALHDARREVEVLRSETGALRAEAATLRDALAASTARGAEQEAERTAALRAEVGDLRELVSRYRQGFDEARQAAVMARREAEQARRAVESGRTEQAAEGQRLDDIVQQLFGAAAARAASSAAPGSAAAPRRRLPSAAERRQSQAAAAGSRAPIGGLDDEFAPRALLDLDGRFKHLNAPFAKLVGYQEQEFSNARWPSVHDRSALAEQEEQLRRLAAGELDGVRVQSTYMHGQGLMVLVSGELSLARDAHGNPDHLVLSAEDRGTDG